MTRVIEISTKHIPHSLARNIHPDHNSSTILKRAPSERQVHLIGRGTSSIREQLKTNKWYQKLFIIKYIFLVTIYRESLYLSVALVSLKRNCGRSKNLKRFRQVYAVIFLGSRNCVDSGEKSVTSQSGKWFRWDPPVN